MFVLSDLNVCSFSKLCFYLCIMISAEYLILPIPTCKFAPNHAMQPIGWTKKCATWCLPAQPNGFYLLLHFTVWKEYSKKLVAPFFWLSSFFTIQLSCKFGEWVIYSIDGVAASLQSISFGGLCWNDLWSNTECVFVTGNLCVLFWSNGRNVSLRASEPTWMLLIWVFYTYLSNPMGTMIARVFYTDHFDPTGAMLALCFSPLIQSAQR